MKLHHIIFLIYVFLCISGAAVHGLAGEEVDEDAESDGDNLSQPPAEQEEPFQLGDLNIDDIQGKYVAEYQNRASEVCQWRTYGSVMNTVVREPTKQGKNVCTIVPWNIVTLLYIEGTSFVQQAKGKQAKGTNTAATSIANFFAPRGNTGSIVCVHVCELIARVRVTR